MKSNFTLLIALLVNYIENNAEIQIRNLKRKNKDQLTSIHILTWFHNCINEYRFYKILLYIVITTYLIECQNVYYI